MDLRGTLREMMASARNVKPIQFVLVGAEGAERPLFVDAQGEQVVAREGHGDAVATLRIDEPALARALAEESRLLRVSLEQMFLAKEITVEGRWHSFEEFVDAAHRWQCPPRPPSSRRLRAAPAAPPKPTVPTYPRLPAIERRGEISKEEFLEKYFQPGTPVILTEPAKQWPLVTMGVAEISARMSRYQGFVRRGAYGVGEGRDERERGNSPVSLDDYLAKMASPTEQGEFPPYLGNNPLPDAFSELVAYPPFFDRSAFTAYRLWIGPAGTLTPLHRDANDNFFVQVAGTKHFTLAAPDQVDFVYCKHISASVDPDNRDYGRYPLFEKAHLVDFEIGPGEMLFLPEAWFHQVRSKSVSVSLNTWMVHSRGIFAALQR